MMDLAWFEWPVLIYLLQATCTYVLTVRTVPHVIGASLSEPHLDGTSAIFHIIIVIMVCMFAQQKKFDGQRCACAASCK